MMVLALCLLLFWLVVWEWMEHEEEIGTAHPPLGFNV